ncbi:MAG: MarR family winged helix-turn-helix transcriptional regulator [Gaiellales bacterium]
MDAAIRLSEQAFLDQVRDAAVLRAALRRFDADTARVVRRCRLTPQRYVLLLMIKGAPDGRKDSTVSAIAQRLRMPHNTISELVTRAVVAGLVKREPTPEDRRSTRLSLTAEGDERLRCAVSQLEDQRAALRRSLQRTRR